MVGAICLAKARDASRSCRRRSPTPPVNMFASVTTTATGMPAAVDQDVPCDAVDLLGAVEAQTPVIG